MSFNIIDDITSYISNGNTEKIISMLGDRVDINGDDVSRSSAKYIIKTFFNVNKPKSFSVIHRGCDGKSSKFLVGNYRTLAGREFKMTVYIRNFNGKYILKSIDIDW